MRYVIPLAILWAAHASLLAAPVLARNPGGHAGSARVTTPSRGPSTASLSRRVIPATSSGGHGSIPNPTPNNRGHHRGNGSAGVANGINFGVKGAKIQLGNVPNRVVVVERRNPPTFVVPVKPVRVQPIRPVLPANPPVVTPIVVSPPVVKPIVVNPPVVKPIVANPLVVTPTVVTPTNVESPANVLPGVRVPIQAAVPPQVNPPVVAGRQISDDEVDHAKKLFQQHLLELTNLLEKRLPAVEFDLQQLLALMVANVVAPSQQLEIVDALQRGDLEAAERLWRIVLPGVAVPFRPCPARLLLIHFRILLERGHPPYRVFRELVASLPPAVLRERACCGADDLLAQLEQEVPIFQAISGSPQEVPETMERPTGFGKPSRATGPSSPLTSVSTEQPFPPTVPSLEGDTAAYGKRRTDATPGQSVALPTGIVNIVYHPKLPERSVVVVNPQTVMIGTGGQGEFHIEQGNVAQALGDNPYEASTVHEAERSVLKRETAYVPAF
jgi:hypothetical protein